MRRPSGVVVKPAGQWAGEQAWYSASGKLKHHVGISIFSMGAFTMAEKLELARVLSSIYFSFLMELASLLSRASVIAVSMWPRLARRFCPNEIRCMDQLFRFRPQIIQIDPARPK